jgi:hypothetical protein
MAHIPRLRFAGAKTTFRLGFRGNPSRHNLQLGKKEFLQMSIFLLIIVLIVLLAMWIGWWTLQQEERGGVIQPGSTPDIRVWLAMHLLRARSALHDYR